MPPLPVSRSRSRVAARTLLDCLQPAEPGVSFSSAARVDACSRSNCDCCQGRPVLGGLLDLIVAVEACARDTGACSLSRSFDHAADPPTGLLDLAAAEKADGAVFAMDHRSMTSFTASRTARTLSVLTTSNIDAMRRCSGVGRTEGFPGGGSSRLCPSSGLSPTHCKTSIACLRVCQSEDTPRQLSKHGMRAGNASSNSAPLTACIA
mmetsp:Transcript_118508/g.335198  ORF Transcript_118508/g.335198 Transcript_118508/m.335198 type:complete len:207 (-) Transcript_118508:786-1406(-)